MTTLHSPCVALALAICVVACGNVSEAPTPDATQPADASPGDAPARDASPDAPSLDAPPLDDLDRDGHPARTDCDDDDPIVWQSLPYAFRDTDGDEHFVMVAGTICSGASLPGGYSLVPAASDCDDSDPAVFTAVIGFVDGDGDDVGEGLAVSFCTAGDLPAGFAATGDDCEPVNPLRWQDLPYSARDVDGDGALVPEVGDVCSGAALPPTYLTAPASQPFDCDDADSAVSIELTLFVDGDLDGFGAGAGQFACTNGTPPAGFSTAGTDCDDADAGAWVSLHYAAVDFDGDEFTAPQSGVRCTAGVLLPPYHAAPAGNDCDDTDPSIWVGLTVFADGDGDGFGTGPSQPACTSGAPPDGFSTAGTDCDDDDDSRWTLVAYLGIDADGDGVTVPASGLLCTDGTLPPPFEPATNGNDCDDDDPALTHLAVLYPDQDDDGVGAPPRQVLCIGTAAPEGFTVGGYDDDDTDSTVIEDEDFDELLELLILDG